MPVGARIQRWLGILVLAGAGGCGTNRVPTGPLPPPAGKQLISVGRLPVHVYEHLAGDGYARTLIKAKSSGNVCIEVRNLFPCDHDKALEGQRGCSEDR